jgi:ABC-type oligopeptide transport system substrate-binding subunit
VVQGKGNPNDQPACSLATLATMLSKGVVYPTSCPESKHFALRIVMLRVNHLQPPFDNPAILRALLGAIDQSAFMTAVAGDDPAFQSSPIGFFAPGTVMASDVGLDVLRGPRDMAKVKADLKAAGYDGEKVVLLVPTNSLAQKPLGDVRPTCCSGPA